jgi:hypothetical protein
MAKQVLEITEKDLATNAVLDSIIEQIAKWQESKNTHRTPDYHKGFLEGLRLAGAIVRGELAEIYEEEEEGGE